MEQIQNLYFRYLIAFFGNLPSADLKQHLIFFTVYAILKDKKFGGELYGTVLQYYRLL